MSQTQYDNTCKDGLLVYECLKYKMSSNGTGEWWQYR